MSEESRKRQAREDAEIEREIRSQREFSLAEAIAREGGDLLKGASPVKRKRQAELEIRQHLERHLDDSEGALGVVLLRRVRESESLLETGYEQPLAILARVTERILGSEARLRRFVAAVDAEWGRIYSERPYFERDGEPDSRDPYTNSSVRESLERLLERLSPGNGKA